MGLCQVGILLYFCSTFLVELNEVLLMLQYFFKKLLPSSATPYLLPISHLLFKALNSSRLFFRRCEHASAFVKVSINKLMFVEIVSTRLFNQFLVLMTALVVVRKNLVAESLLQRAQFNHFLV